MKKLFTLLLVSLFAFTSCKKDDDESSSIQNSTSAEEIQSILLDGYWQHYQFKNQNDVTVKDAEYYEAYEFLNKDRLDYYLSKKSKYTYDQPWYYSIRTLAGKAVFILFANREAFEKDEFNPDHAHEIKIQNGFLIMINKKTKVENIYKKFNSISETKDLREGT